MPSAHEQRVTPQRRLNELQDFEAGQVGELLAQGARLDALYEGRLPMQRAAQFGNAKVVAAMIAAGAQLESGGQLNWTALHLAAHNGRAEVCRVLLHAGANWRALNVDGRTPLALAGQVGWGEVVRVFVDRLGEKLDVKDASEALEVIAAKNTMPEYTQLLIEHLGGGQDLVNETFWVAVKGGNLAVAKHLVERGADWRNPPGGRSLLQMAQRGADDLKRYLRALKTGEAIEDAMAERVDASHSGPRRDSPGVL